MLLIIGLPGSGYAQNVDWQQIDENQAQFGFVGYQGARKNVAIDGAGNIITCAPFGNKIHIDTQAFTTNFETVIVKRSPAGNVLWSRTLRGTGFKYGHSIHADSVGNIYLLGWYYGNSSIDGVGIPSYGNYDCFLVKINSSGQTVYVKTFGSSGYDYPFALDTDASGNVWVAGKFTFSMQLGSSTLTGTANSHFLFKLSTTGSLLFLKNICQNAGTDWGIGDLSRSSQGKIAVVSNFVGTSAFQTKTLTGGGGYLAIINSATGDLDTVLHAGNQAWLIDHEPGGNMVILGLQGSNTDSIASEKLPGLQAGNQLFIARVRGTGITEKVMAIPKQSGSFTQAESFRSLHVNKAGQIFLSGELESEIWISPNKLLSLNLPHQAGKPQAILAKLDENFNCAWFAGVGSKDTLASPNKNIGAGVFSDPTGNIVWCTMNDAYSVVSSHLRLNNDTFDEGNLSSRYAAHGVHVWKFSEPSVRTLMPQFTTYCPGDSIHIPYQKFGDFNANNRFSLELSDSAGSFVNPFLIRENIDSASGTLHALIPLQIKASNFYRFRVNASWPSVYGSIVENNIAIRGKPSADAGPDRYFCLGDTIRVLASGGGSYSWSAPGNLIQKDSAWLIALPDTHRIYHVRVYDSISSCFNDDSLMMRYREEVVLDAIRDTLACLGDSVVFYAHILVGDSSRVKYTWMDSFGNILSVVDSFVWHAIAPNHMRLVVWDSCSVLPDTQQFRISIRPALQAHTTADTLVCSNLPLVLLAAGTGGFYNGYRFVWMDSSFQQVLGEGVQFDSLFPGNGRIGVRLSDGCSSNEDSILVWVQVAEPPVVIKHDTIMVCALDTVTLRVDASGGYPGQLLYSWDSTSFITADSLIDVFTSSVQISVVLKDACGLTSLGKTQVQVRMPLALNVRPDSIFCLGEQVQLYVGGSESDTGHYSFFWEGSSEPDNYFFEKPSETGTYRVRIRNNCDASDQIDSVRLTVRDSLHIDLFIDTPYCYGEQVQLTPVVSGGYPATHALLWKELDGTLIGNFPSFQTDLRGNMDLWLILEDACTTPSDSLLIRLNTRPPLSIVDPGDTLLCHGAFFRFVPTLTGGKSPGYSYTISPWDSASLSAGVVISSPETLEVVASDNCSESDTMRFNILLRDQLVVELPADTALCRGQPLQLIPLISGGKTGNYSFFWQGIVSQSSQYNYTVSRDTTLVFEVNDGCSASARDSIRVSAWALPHSTFDLSDTQICAPYITIARSSFYSQAARWRWRSEALVLDTITLVQTLPVFIKTKGKYLIDLEITDSNGCVSFPTQRQIEAFSSPNAQFSFSDSVIDRGEGVDLFVYKDQIISSVWQPVNVDSLAPGHFFYVPDDTGIFFLHHLATNQWGCTDDYTGSIRVKEPFNCYVPNAFYPSGFLENHVFLPVCEPWLEYSLRIYSRWGQLVFESDESAQGWNGSYMGNGDILPAGVYVYILRVSNEYHEVFQSKGTVTLVK